MAITQNQSNNNGVTNAASGSYLTDGTAAAIEVETGFRPRHVRVMNATSRDEMEWFEGMAEASAVKGVAAGTKTLITSNGITVNERGFTIGLDTDVNVKDEQLYWVALG